MFGSSGHQSHVTMNTVGKEMKWRFGASVILYPVLPPILIDLLEETTDELEHFEDELEEKNPDVAKDYELPSDKD